MYILRFRDEPRRMLKITQRFIKHYGGHLRGEYTTLRVSVYPEDGNCSVC